MNRFLYKLLLMSSLPLLLAACTVSEPRAKEIADQTFSDICKKSGLIPGEWKPRTGPHRLDWDPPYYSFSWRKDYGPTTHQTVYVCVSTRGKIRPIGEDKGHATTKTMILLPDAQF